MHITTIKLMKRKNLGNYEHEEITMEASLTEGDDHIAAIIKLKELVHAALESDLTGLEATEKVSTYVEKVALKPLGNEPVATANFVKEAPVKEEKPKAAPRTRAKKEEAAKEETTTVETPSTDVGGTQPVADKPSGEVQPPVEQDKPVAIPPVIGKGIVAYNSTVKEQRSRFATYLGSTYPKWKTAHPEEKIKAFSLALQGKPFEDAKGNMLDSFKAELEAFFGHAK